MAKKNKYLHTINECCVHDAQSHKLRSVAMCAVQRKWPFNWTQSFYVKFAKTTLFDIKILIKYVLISIKQTKEHVMFLSTLQHILFLIIIPEVWNTSIWYPWTLHYKLLAW